jgi:hypothetical protein
MIKEKIIFYINKILFYIKTKQKKENRKKIEIGNSWENKQKLEKTVEKTLLGRPTRLPRCVWTGMCSAPSSK